jgi:hypothetical protein
LIYLFANSSVLEFYPKFGFKRIVENRYELDGEKIIKQKATIKKLNICNPDDKNILLKIASDRVPVSKKIGVIRDKWPLLAYCLDDLSRACLKKNLFYLFRLKSHQSSLEMFCIRQYSCAFCFDERNLISKIRRIFFFRHALRTFYFICLYQRQS